MQINIFPPVALCERGRRSKNEDNIYPILGNATAANHTFLVCDGVGGAEKGEVASQIVTQTFGVAFEQQMASSALLHKVLDQVQREVDDYIRKQQVKGMGTTLTFLQLNENGAIIAHAGDSRVYHIRGNKVLFCTSDHSLVNELKKKGLYEEAELAGDNIITRAIQGASVKAINLDVEHISNIQAGDYFLLCSDGVWGVIPDENLGNILDTNSSDEEKIDQIEQRCIQSSKDNYSAYLIKIQSVVSVPDDDATIYAGTSGSLTVSEFEQPRILVENTQEKNGFNWLKLLATLSLLGIVGFGTWCFLEQKNKGSTEDNQITPSVDYIENKEIIPVKENNDLEKPVLEKEEVAKKNPKKKKSKKVGILKPGKREVAPVPMLSKEIAPAIPLEELAQQRPQTKSDSELVPPPSILIDSLDKN